MKVAKGSILAFIFLSSLSFAKVLPAYQGDLNPDAIIDFIQLNKIKTADELLSTLPLELRSHFTLAHHSHSLQRDCATKEQPRAILFSPSQDFALAFAGNPEKPGCSGVEMMKLNQTTARVRVREYNFDGSREQSCVRCHGAESRPIWSSYPNWPGMYGEQEDVVADPTEFINNKKVWVNQAGYRQLQWQDPKSLFPYSKSQLSVTLRPNLALTTFFVRENATRLARVYQESPGFDRYKYVTEELLLGCPVDLAQRKSDPVIQRFFDEGDLELPANAERFKDINFRQDTTLETRAPGTLFKPDWFSLNIINPVDEALALSNPFLDRDFSDGTNGSRAFVAVHVLEGLAKNDPDLRPFLKYRSALSSYQNPTPPPPLDEQLRSEIFPESLKSDLKWIDEKGRLIEAFDYTASENFSHLCGLLAQKALAKSALKNDGILPISNAAKSVSRIAASNGAFAKCVHCHDGSTRFPVIPFGNDSDLRQYLKKGNFPRGTLAQEIIWRIDLAPLGDKMPFDTDLSEEEARAIHRFINGEDHP